ncbi:MAG: EAL domain-containing protein [Betaproteobacteria bacterium]|nr:EAL domain-containing protein [Betaproteobacteria bacterium]
MSKLSARANTEVQLQRSEARFRALTELSSDWYWEQDEQFRFTSFAGPRADANAAGGDPSIYIGKARWEIPDLTPLESDWEQHRRQLERHESFRDMVFQRRMRDGSIRFMAISGEPIFGADGRFAGYCGVGRDITQQRRAEDDLRRFRLAMDSSADMIGLVDRASMRFVDVNSTMCRLLGYSREELLTMPLDQLLPQSISELEAAYDKQIANPTVPGGLNSHYLCKDGSRLPFESKRQVMRVGERWVISVVSRDIRERIKAEEELRSTVSLLTATLESTADGILVVAADKRISRFNQRFVDMWRIPQNVIEARDDTLAISFVLDQVTDPQGFIAKIEELYSRPLDESFDTIEFKDGRTFERYSRPQLVAGVPSGRVWSFRDVTERRRAEERIHILAFQDALTELPNRVLFRDRMEQAMAHADRAGNKAAVLFLDLDNFKSINDSLGHVAGDALLKMAAERIRSSIRETDTLSRQGGDEFLIMLTEVPMADAVTPVVEKLVSQFQSPFEIEGRELTTTVSIGIALYPDDGEDFDTLLKKADTAMYRAKDEGRNAYRFFDAHMNVEAVEYLNLRNGLQSAVRRGEFVLFFQPQIDLSRGKMVGAEALLRWNHPQEGIVLPERFITIAEESGLIVPIGEWVLLEACRQAARWRRSGHANLSVGVNLSAVQFRRGGLEKAVRAALDDSGIDPAMLELEITESMLIEGTQDNLETVKRLKHLGVKLSIDDFGSGYSSLSYLRRFEVDKLKIDQSFIRDIGSDPDDAAIVRSIVQMAHSLELRTVAEGVDAASLVHRLRECGCDEAQGYYFGEPVPAARLFAAC